MKKIVFVICLIFILSSCFGSWEDKEDLQDLKKELLWKTDSKVEKENEIEDKKDENDEKEENIEETEKNSLTKNYLTEEKFIEFDDLQVSDFDSLEKEIIGKTLLNVDKIIVKFSNPDSNFPNDSFQLKKFKSWDKTFLYRAFKKYETIDYGENTYIFEAYSGEKVSKLELKVNIYKEKKEPVSLENLPEDWVFWSPKELWNGNITYTDIKWLEIEKLWEIDLKMEADSITNYLQSKLGTWFYWNTLRYIKDKTGVSFYVVSKDWENYKYEKHYYNYAGLYGILELEKWDLDMSEWEKIGEVLKQKNSELREKNDDFTITSISDALFKKLTN